MSATTGPAAQGPRSPTPEEVAWQTAELLFRGLRIIEQDNPKLTREQAAAVLRRHLEEGT